LKRFTIQYTLDDEIAFMSLLRKVFAFCQKLLKTLSVVQTDVCWRKLHRNAEFRVTYRWQKGFIVLDWQWSLETVTQPTRSDCIFIIIIIIFFFLQKFALDLWCQIGHWGLFILIFYFYLLFVFRRCSASK
jgi:hypothetical protein